MIDPNVTPVADAAAGSNTTVTPPVAGTQPGGQAPQEFKLTRDEWVDFRRELRNLKVKSETPAATPTPDGDRVAALEFKLAIKDALADHGISDPKARRLIEDAARAAKPEDLSHFVESYKDLFPAKSAAATVSPVNQVAAPSAPSNTGAPAGAGGGTLPSNPLEWPQEVINRTPPVEFKAALDNYFGGGRGHNPYKGLKRPHER